MRNEGRRQWLTFRRERLRRRCCRQKTSSHSRRERVRCDGDHRRHDRRHKTKNWLPLPSGEGWGEGRALPRTFSTRTIRRAFYELSQMPPITARRATKKRGLSPKTGALSRRERAGVRCVLIKEAHSPRIIAPAISFSCSQSDSFEPGASQRSNRHA
jgi:hypothetical protein